MQSLVPAGGVRSQLVSLDAYVLVSLDKVAAWLDRWTIREFSVRMRKNTLIYHDVIPGTTRLCAGTFVRVTLTLADGRTKIIEHQGHDSHAILAAVTETFLGA